MITINTKVGYDVVPFSSENENYMLLELTGKEIDITNKRPTISLIALIDVSGSMDSPKKISYVKKSMVKLIENLSETDKLGLISYSRRGQVLMRVCNMSADNKKKAIEIVNNLRIESTTNIGDALSCGFKEAKELAAKEGINRIILFTDGCPTEGVTEHELLVNLTKNKPDIFQVTTMGYGEPSTTDKNKYQVTSFLNGMGNELNVDLLEDIANAGLGNFYYMSDPDTCAKAFANELAGLLTSVAQRIEIKIESKHSKIIEVLDDVDVEEKDGNTIITVPDIYSGETRYILIKVLTDKQSKAWARPASIAKIEVKYVNTINGNDEVINSSAKVTFGKEDDASKELNADVKTQLALIDAIKMQEQAFQFAAAGNFSAANSIMNDARDALFSTGTARGQSFSESYVACAAVYSDSKNFSMNSDSLKSGIRSLKKQRATGSSFDILNSTSHQKSMQDEFKFDDPSATDDGVGQIKLGPIVTDPIVIDPIVIDINKTEDKRSISKKSRTNRW